MCITRRQLVMFLLFYHHTISIDCLVVYSLLFEYCPIFSLWLATLHTGSWILVIQSSISRSCHILHKNIHIVGKAFVFNTMFADYMPLFIVTIPFACMAYTYLTALPSLQRSPGIAKDVVCCCSVHNYRVQLH